MTERDPRRRLAAARARAEAATAKRAAADRAARRAERVAHARAALARAEALRAARPIVGAAIYTRPPTTPALEALASRERSVPGIIVAADHLAAEMHADALAAVPETHAAYDWSRE